MKPLPLQKQYKEAKANEFKSPDITLRKTPLLKDDKYANKRKLASSFYKVKDNSQELDRVQIQKPHSRIQTVETNPLIISRTSQPT